VYKLHVNNVNCVKVKNKATEITNVVEANMRDARHLDRETRMRIKDEITAVG